MYYVIDAGWRESSYDTYAEAKKNAVDWVTATTGPRDKTVLLSVVEPGRTGRRYVEIVVNEKGY